MTDQDYRFQSEQLLQEVEQYIENSWDEYDCRRNGNVLTIELTNKKEIVINLQEFKKEVWMAGAKGAFHFKYDKNLWIDTRDKHDFFKKLKYLLAQS